ncbi:transglycosylase SLT domain-containing protein [Streptomyces sp. NPDC053079]|uniref:transglycosylase SLT domain-containing protein n=1 Tax=Streptomyces sp. NPDC053079 TaxID=3365697 RepID=UPI0037D2EE66
MRSTTVSGYTRLAKVHKFSVAGIAAVGVAAAAFTAVPAVAADAGSASVKPVAWSAQSFGETQDAVLAQLEAEAATLAKAEAKAAVKAGADAAAKAKADAEKERAAKEAASRSTERKPVKAAAPAKPAKPAAPAAKPAAPAKKAYADNLDGWINEALDIMKAKGIPGTYAGIKKNVMRESTGNPRAMNNWDSNAAAGIPSKGLLQIIDPTFKAFHVEGTAWDPFDPVANIVASCNYAAGKYGSMDNVNSAY